MQIVTTKIDDRLFDKMNDEMKKVRVSKSTFTRSAIEFYIKALNDGANRDRHKVIAQAKMIGLVVYDNGSAL